MGSSSDNGCGTDYVRIYFGGKFVLTKIVVDTVFRLWHYLIIETQTNRTETMNITSNELKVLQSIATNFFGQQVGDPVWADCINDSHKPSRIEGKALSGVCASLAKKGLIETDGDCVCITEKGVELAG